MKRFAIACLLVCSLLLASAQENQTTTTEAASCVPPTCIVIGDFFTSDYKPGWYQSVGKCIFVVKYYNDKGVLVNVNRDYEYNYSNIKALFYVGNTASNGRYPVRVIRIVSVQGVDDGLNYAYNNCKTFRWARP